MEQQTSVHVSLSSIITSDLISHEGICVTSKPLLIQQTLYMTESAGGTEHITCRREINVMHVWGFIVERNNTGNLTYVTKDTTVHYCVWVQILLFLTDFSISNTAAIAEDKMYPSLL